MLERELRYWHLHWLVVAVVLVVVEVGNPERDKTTVVVVSVAAVGTVQMPFFVVVVVITVFDDCCFSFFLLFELFCRFFVIKKFKLFHEENMRGNEYWTHTTESFYSMSLRISLVMLSMELMCGTTARLIINEVDTFFSLNC